MPTEKPRFTVTLDKETYERLKTFRFNNCYETKSQAVLDLVKLALNHGELFDELDQRKKLEDE